MKRATTMLGALALAFAGFLFAAPAAHAIPPAPAGSLGCTLVIDQSSWPRNGNYYYCGTTPALYKNNAASYVNSLPTKLKNKLINNKTWLMILDDTSEADTYFGGNLPANVVGNTYSVTWDGGVNTYVFITSWETNLSSDMQEILVHEQGHALDFAFGADIGEPSGVSQAVSTFWTNVNNDWTYINGLSRAVVFPHGIPPKKIDEPGGTWTNYNPSPTATNKEIFEDLYPWLLDGSSLADAELFAHLYVTYRHQFLNDCPYEEVPDGMGGTDDYLDWEETFTQFQMTKNVSGRYFRTMWYDTDNFVP